MLRAGAALTLCVVVGAILDGMMAHARRDEGTQDGQPSQHLGTKGGVLLGFLAAFAVFRLTARSRDAPADRNRREETRVEEQSLLDFEESNDYTSGQRLRVSTKILEAGVLDELKQHLGEPLRGPAGEYFTLKVKRQRVVKGVRYTYFEPLNPEEPHNLLVL